MTSVAPTHTQNTVINNIFTQNQTILDPSLLEGFGKWFMDSVDSGIDDDVVDAEVDDDAI